MSDPLCDGCGAPISIGDDEHQSLDALRLFHAECCFQSPDECDLLHPGDPGYPLYEMEQ